MFNGKTDLGSLCVFGPQQPASQRARLQTQKLVRDSRLDVCVWITRTVFSLCFWSRATATNREQGQVQEDPVVLRVRGSVRDAQDQSCPVCPCPCLCSQLSVFCAISLHFCFQIQDLGDVG